MDGANSTGGKTPGSPKEIPVTHSDADEVIGLNSQEPVAGQADVDMTDEDAADEFDPEEALLADGYQPADQSDSQFDPDAQMADAASNEEEEELQKEYLKLVDNKAQAAEITIPTYSSANLGPFLGPMQTLRQTLDEAKPKNQTFDNRFGVLDSDDIDDIRPTQWAKSALLEFLVRKANTDAKAGWYIAPLWAVDIFVDRGKYKIDTKRCVENLQAKVEELKQFPAGTPPVDRYILPEIPDDTTTISFIYNIHGVHWVHVEVQADRGKNYGVINIYDSKKNYREYSLDVVRAELPILLKLVSARPALRWWNGIQWQTPVLKEDVPRQHGDDDCGFLALRSAIQSSRGKALDDGLYKVSEVGDWQRCYNGLRCRADALAQVFEHFMGHPMDHISDDSLKLFTTQLKAATTPGTKPTTGVQTSAPSYGPSQIQETSIDAANPPTSPTSPASPTSSSQVATVLKSDNSDHNPDPDLGAVSLPQGQFATVPASTTGSTHGQMPPSDISGSPSLEKGPHDHEHGSKPSGTPACAESAKPSNGTADEAEAQGGDPSHQSTLVSSISAHAIKEAEGLELEGAEPSQKVTSLSPISADQIEKTTEMEVGDAELSSSETAKTTKESAKKKQPSLLVKNCKETVDKTEPENADPALKASSSNPATKTKKAEKNTTAGNFSITNYFSPAQSSQASHGQSSSEGALTAQQTPGQSTSTPYHAQEPSASDGPLKKDTKHSTQKPQMPKQPRETADFKIPRVPGRWMNKFFHTFRHYLDPLLRHESTRNAVSEAYKGISPVVAKLDEDEDHRQGAIIPLADSVREPDPDDRESSALPPVGPDPDPDAEQRLAIVLSLLRHYLWTALNDTKIDASKTGYDAEDTTLLARFIEELRRCIRTLTRHLPGGGEDLEPDDSQLREYIDLLAEKFPDDDEDGEPDSDPESELDEHADGDDEAAEPEVPGEEADDDNAAGMDALNNRASEEELEDTLGVDAQMLDGPEDEIEYEDHSDMDISGGEAEDYDKLDGGDCDDGKDGGNEAGPTNQDGPGNDDGYHTPTGDEVEETAEKLSNVSLSPEAKKKAKPTKNAAGSKRKAPPSGGSRSPPAAKRKSRRRGGARPNYNDAQYFEARGIEKME